jgi:hypothetical protein
VLDRAHEMDDAFLPRDAADEEHVWGAGVDSVFLQRSQGGDRLVLFEVDAVVDHAHALGGHVEEAEDVGLGFLRNGDDRVSHFDRGLFDPE